ncbi:death domain-associated protein 6-like [Liolophura sinensis]|uniref:death domain-associated protein 6-like n=1 Tax=Liolophura sinensis TaxID=3198878 RepID=UPI003159334B
MSALLLDEFLVFLKPLITDLKECDRLVKHCKQIFNNCDESFRKSSDFKRLIQSTRSAISNDKQRVYVHIMDFVCELKAHVKDSSKRDGRSKANSKHKRKKRDREKSSGSDSGELPKKKANYGKEVDVSDARVDLPDDGIVIESNVDSPYNQEVSSTCSPSVSPARKPKLVRDGAVSDKNCIILEYGSTSENVTNSEVDKSANAINPEPAVQEEAKSTVVIMEDDSECHRSPQAAVLSTLQLVPKCVDPQPAKAESVSTSLSVIKCPVVPPETASASEEKTLGKPSSSIEQGAMCTLDDDDKQKYANASSEPASRSSKGAKDQESASGIEKTKCTNALSESASTSKEKVKVEPPISKDQDSESGIDDMKNCADVPSTPNKQAAVKPSSGKDQDSASGVDDKKTLVSEKHIRKLEILLAKLRNEIENVKERELSLDDLEDEDSSYIYEDRLEKKFVKVWNKLCELKGRRKTTGRPVEQRFTYEGTRFPEINKKIERFINKKKMFPDFHDIRDIIIKVNKRKELNLSSQMVEMISRDTFMDVGNRLQERRREDFVTTFGCRLTDNANPNDDPALRDPALKAKLENNLSEGKQKMQDLILKYAHEQYNREEEPEEQGDQSEKEKREMSCSPTNEEEEEEEEVCVPELDEVLNDTVCEPEQENSCEMKMGGNEEEDVIELSTDEDEDDAQSDEDSENEDNRLPKTFTSVLESMHQEKLDTEDDDSQDAVLEIKSESDGIQAIDNVVEIGDEDDEEEDGDDKCNEDSPTLVLDDSIYLDVADDSDVLSVSEFSPLTTENTETSDSEAGDPSNEMFKSPERRLKKSKLSILTPQKSLLRKALGLKSPSKSPKRISFPVKKRSVECLDDDDDSGSEGNISSSVPTRSSKLSLGSHSELSHSPRPSTSSQYGPSEEVVCIQPEPSPFSVDDPVISSSTGDPSKGQNSHSDDEVIVLDSD